MDQSFLLAKLCQFSFILVFVGNQTCLSNQTSHVKDLPVPIKYLLVPDNGTEAFVHLDSRIKFIQDSCQLHKALSLYVDFFYLFLLFYTGRSPTVSKLILKIIILNKQLEQ